MLAARSRFARLPADAAVRRSTARVGRRVGLAVRAFCVVGMAGDKHVRAVQQTRRHVSGLPVSAALLLYVRSLDKLGTMMLSKVEAKGQMRVLVLCSGTGSVDSAFERRSMHHKHAVA